MIRYYYTIASTYRLDNLRDDDYLKGVDYLFLKMLKGGYFYEDQAAS